MISLWLLHLLSTSIIDVCISASTEKASVDDTKPEETAASKPTEKAPINKKMYQTRLGLARATAKHTDDLTESKKYYNEVIDLAPQVNQKAWCSN